MTSRLIYSLLFYLVQPLLWLRLLWRARRQPEYLCRLGERYGLYPERARGRPIWLHAVSVGETRAAEPLIKALLEEFPAVEVLLTHMTPTGRVTGEELCAKYAPRLRQAYLPYDLPDACGRFLAYFQPRIGLLMETEIWPNLIAAARRREIPIVLVNARLSERSQRAYQRIRSLIRPALAGFSAVLAQTASDAQRLSSLGAKRVQIFGNLKFDVTPALEKLALGAAWRQALAERPVWLAASTREGEEALILDAFARLGRPDCLLLLVPRHPQRFAEVAGLLAERRLSFARRSEDRLPDATMRVWLGDSLGEMPAYFSLADVALIGGTLRPFGGQNLIEAAACGCPVLVGPHTDNFAQATEDALAGGAARRIADAGEAALKVGKLLDDRATLRTMKEAAIRFSLAHRGATARTLARVREILADGDPATVSSTSRTAD